MKKTVFVGLAVMLFAGSLLAGLVNYRVMFNDTDAWVTLFKESSNGNSTYEVGDACLVEYSGTFAFVRRLNNEEAIVVAMYNNPNGGLGYGSRCGNSAQFLASEESWNEILRRHAATQK